MTSGRNVLITTDPKREAASCSADATPAPHSNWTFPSQSADRSNAIRARIKLPVNTKRRRGGRALNGRPQRVADGSLVTSKDQTRMFARLKVPARTAWRRSDCKIAQMYPSRLIGPLKLNKWFQYAKYFGYVRLASARPGTTRIVKFQRKFIDCVGHSSDVNVVFHLRPTT